MMAIEILEGIFHCDGYYEPNVCPSKGKQDEADLRYNKDGWLKPKRHLCLTNGQSPMTDMNLCRHCIEIRHLFYKKARKLNGKVT
jgi:hypothetical protein